MTWLSRAAKRWVAQRRRWTTPLQEVAHGRWIAIPPDLFVPDSQFPRVRRSRRFRAPPADLAPHQPFSERCHPSKFSIGGGVEWRSVIPPGTFGLGNTLAGMRSRAPTQQTPTVASFRAGGAAPWSSTAASTSRVWWRRLRFGVGHRRLVVSPVLGSSRLSRPAKSETLHPSEPATAEPLRASSTHGVQLAAASAPQRADVLSPVCEFPCGQLEWLGFIYDAAAGTLRIRSMCQRVLSGSSYMIVCRPSVLTGGGASVASVTTSPGERTDRGSRYRGEGRDSGIHLKPPPPLTSPLSPLLPRTADANGLQALFLRRPPPSGTSLAPTAVKTVPPFTTSAPRLGGGRPCTSPHGNGHGHAPCVPAAKTAACPVAARPCGGYATPLLVAGCWQRHAHTRGALHRAACFLPSVPPHPLGGGRGSCAPALRGGAASPGLQTERPRQNQLFLRALPSALDAAPHPVTIFHTPPPGRSTAASAS